MALTPEQQDKLDKSIWLAQQAQAKLANQPAPPPAPVQAAEPPPDNSYLGIFSDAVKPVTNALQQSLDPIGYQQSHPEPNASMAPPNASVAPPVAPAAIPTPVAPQQPATQALAAQALSKVRGGGAGSGPKSLTDSELDDLVRDPSRITPATFSHLSVADQDRLNARLQSGAEQNAMNRAAGLENTRMGNEEQKVKNQEGFDSIEKLSHAANQYWDDENSRAMQQDAEEHMNAVKRAQAANEAVRDFKINPNRYTQNMGLGQKLLTGLSLALGAFGGARNGGQNSAVPVLNSFIDRDIGSQEAELGAKKTASENDKNLLLQLERSLGNRQLARQAAKAAYMQKYADATKELMNTAATSQRRAELGLQHQDIQSAADNAHEAFVNSMVNQSENTNAARRQAAAAAVEAKRKEVQASFDKAEETVNKELESGTIKPEMADVRRAQIVAQRTGLPIGQVAAYMPGFGTNLNQAPSSERKEAGEKTDQGAQHIATELNAKNIPALETALNDIKPEDINYGPNWIQREVQSGNSQFNKSAVNALSSSEGIAARQRLSDAQQLYLRMLTGAGMSAQEAQLNADAVFGDYSPEAINRGIGKIRSEVDAQKSNIVAGAGPQAALAYQSRLPPKIVEKPAR